MVGADKPNFAEVEAVNVQSDVRFGFPLHPDESNCSADSANLRRLRDADAWLYRYQSAVNAIRLKLFHFGNDVLWWHPIQP